jgi:hypothetical protein
MQLELAVPLTLAATDNRAITWLTSLASCATFGTLASRADRVTTTLGPTFTTAVWVINRVHGRATNMRSSPQPAGTPRFAETDIHVIAVADLADRGPTDAGYTPDFTARQSQLSPIGLTSHQGCLRPCRSTEDRTATGPQLDAANRGP